jgi:DsbC/DsbD-like thiol-disulfide interchange protein
VQLQATLPRLAAHGILPVALSYDPPTVLAAFAAAHGITYPLLADDGSRVIRALGILNTSVAPTDVHYGIPYPGVYFTGADGRVVDKIFHATHRTRDAAATAVREHFGLDVAADGLQVRLETDGLSVVAAMDSASSVRRERIGLRVTIQMAAGVHIYGQPQPEGYLPTTLEVRAPGTVMVEPVAYPPPRPLHVASGDGDLPAYTGTIALSTAVIFAEQRDDVAITAMLRFQACTTEECFTPQDLILTLPMHAARSPRQGRRSAHHGRDAAHLSGVG